MSLPHLTPFVLVLYCSMLFPNPVPCVKLRITYFIFRDVVTIELENRLPASLSDMDESYKDEIVRRDATESPVVDLPGRKLAGPPC